MIRYCTGTLFTDPVEALVNPVNTVGVMGKGLAEQFKRAYPHVFLEYQRACQAGSLIPGRVWVAWTGRTHNPTRIIHFPTKRHWAQASRRQDIVDGLRDMAHVIRTYPIASVAVPALGCGLGGLAWEDVEPLMLEHLGALAAEIHIYPPRP